MHGKHVLIVAYVGWGHVPSCAININMRFFYSDVGGALSSVACVELRHSFEVSAFLLIARAIVLPRQIGGEPVVGGSGVNIVCNVSSVTVGLGDAGVGVHVFVG